MFAGRGVRPCLDQGTLRPATIPLSRSATSHDRGYLGVPHLQSNALVRPATRAARSNRSNRVSQERDCRSQNGDGRGSKNRGRSRSLAAAYDWFHSKINFFTRSCPPLTSGRGTWLHSKVAGLRCALLAMRGCFLLGAWWY